MPCSPFIEFYRNNIRRDVFAESLIVKVDCTRTRIIKLHGTKCLRFKEVRAMERSIPHDIPNEQGTARYGNDAKMFGV